MTTRRLPFLPMVLALASLAAPARASDDPLPRLVVTRGAGAVDCPDATTLKQLVQVLGQREVTTTSTAPNALVVHVSFERNAAGYSALLHTRGSQSGTRALSDIGPGCQSLAEALAVVIAIVLDGEQGKVPALPPAPSVSATSAPRLPPRTHRELRGGAEALGGITVALLEAPVAMGGGGLTLNLGNRLDFLLGGVALQHDQVADNEGEVTLSLAAGMVRGCAAATRQEGNALYLCAASLVGSLQGSGAGFAIHHPEQRLLYSAVGLGPAGQGTLGGGTSWWLGAMAVVPLVRHGFSVREDEQDQEVFHTAPFGLLFTMGLRWEIALR